MAKAKNERDDKPKRDEKKRGTNDDFEILKLIISENRGLYLRVMDKIRTLRGHSKESIFDVATKKQRSRFSSSKAKREEGG